MIGESYTPPRRPTRRSRIPRPIAAPWFIASVGLAVAVALTGCGGGGSDHGGSAGGQASSTPAADDAGSPLNQGPKAVETIELNPGLADWGAKVFQQRACVTCHAIGEKKQGPDLHGVAARRTEAWMTKQITDPEWMVKNDPLSHQLFAQYALQMANQHVPEQEVKALLHFFVQEAQESGVTASTR